MKYTVVGTVPTEPRNPRRPVFDFEPHMKPGPKDYNVIPATPGSGWISVDTDSPAVAETLRSVFEAVFDDVEVFEK